MITFDTFVCLLYPDIASLVTKVVVPLRNAVAFSQSMLVCSVYLFVCMCVCLFVCVQSNGHDFARITTKFVQVIRLTMQIRLNFLGQHRSTVKVKVTKNMKDTISAITFEPEVVETSSWLHNVHNIRAHSVRGLRFFSQTSRCRNVEYM